MIYIDREILFPLRCGTSCFFCQYNQSDDLQHCIFFKSAEETYYINVCAEEKVRYTGCPLVEYEEYIAPELVELE